MEWTLILNIFWCPRCFFLSELLITWSHNRTWSFIIIFFSCVMFICAHECIVTLIRRLHFTQQYLSKHAIKYHCHKQHKRQSEMVSEKITAKKIIGTHLTIWHSVYCFMYTAYLFHIFFHSFDYHIRTMTERSTILQWNMRWAHTKTEQDDIIVEVCNACS